MYKSIRLFSLSVRSLYVDKAVGTSTEASQKFRKLRDDTRNDAMVYLKGILPISTKFVSSISEYFEYYYALEYEEWCEMISDILEETIGYRQLCEALLKMHEDILVPLKRRQDEAKLVISEFEKLRGKFAEKQKEFEAKAQVKTEWAEGLSSLVPVFGPILESVMQGEAAKDLVEAVAHKTEVEVQEAATTAVRDTLIPAIERFIEGITKASGFFSVMELEIRKFESKVEKSKKDPKKLYYKVMRNQAGDMKSICQAFYAILPAVRTDFEAIPTEGTDQNYVDRWLEEQKKVIEEKCTVPLPVKRLVETIIAALESSTEKPKKALEKTQKANN